GGPDTHTSTLPCTATETSSESARRRRPFGRSCVDSDSIAILQSGRRTSVAVGGSEFAHSFHGPAARDVLRQILIQVAQPPRFGAVAQKQAKKIQVRQRLRQLETELRILEVRLSVLGRHTERAQSRVMFERVLPQIDGGRLHIVVIE